MKNLSSSDRFSQTLQYYDRYRPSYPQACIQDILNYCKLEPGAQVADIGSGTGIFTQLLLEQGLKTYAVEPNEGMRHQAEAKLKDYPGFHSVAGDANTTQLEDKSVEAIFCAQAFHWFDPEKARVEFKRILKPEGYVVLIWNLRNSQSDLMRAYENILVQFGTDYQKVKAENISDDRIRDFYQSDFIKKSVIHHQAVDYQGFEGRLLSTSYAAKPGDKNFKSMLQAAKKIFDQHQINQQVTFEYDCIYYMQRL